MKKYVAAGIVIGLVVALVIGLSAGAVFAQGPTPGAPTVNQMKQWHESMHGVGSWDAMVQRMEQAYGKDWFSQMQGPNGVMNGAGMMNGQNPMGAGTAGSMMNGANSQNHMGSGSMMGGWTVTPAPK
jgi:hypothetical protein